MSVGIFTVQYERATDPKLSFFIRLPELFHDSLSSQLTVANEITNTTTVEYMLGSSTNFGISGGLRFFLLGEAPQGLWVSPEVGFGYEILNFSRVDSPLPSQTTLHGGFVSFHFAGSAGYTFLFGPVALSLGAGIGYIGWIGEIFGASYSQRNLRPFVQTGIGYAF